MKKTEIKVFDNSDTNAVATVTINVYKVFASWSYELNEAINRPEPYRSVYACPIGEDRRALIADLIDDYGYDMVNNLFMDMYMQKREEKEAEKNDD